MKNVLINLVLFFKYGYKSTSNLYYKYLKNKGIELGNNVKFYSPWTINIDIQRPWMIKIGNNVKITSGVKILQHGYDWSVLQKKYGDVLGSCGKVDIGNNVFIGVNTTILKDVTICDNVIIGANSLVCKSINKEGVYAGNPAKYLMSIDEYYKKRLDCQIEEAVNLVNMYYLKYGRYPKKELLREFFWLFEERKNEINSVFDDVLKLQDNYEFSKSKFLNSTSKFCGYDDFIDYVIKESNNNE